MKKIKARTLRAVIREAILHEEDLDVGPVYQTSQTDPMGLGQYSDPFGLSDPIGLGQVSYPDDDPVTAARKKSAEESVPSDKPEKKVDPEAEKKKQRQRRRQQRRKQLRATKTKKGRVFSKTIKDRKTGNHFRGWVNKYFPKLAKGKVNQKVRNPFGSKPTFVKGLELDPPTKKTSFLNRYITNAWKLLGDSYIDSNKGDPKSNPEDKYAAPREFGRTGKAADAKKVVDQGVKQAQMKKPESKKTTDTSTKDTPYDDLIVPAFKKVLKKDPDHFKSSIAQMKKHNKATFKQLIKDPTIKAAAIKAHGTSFVNESFKINRALLRQMVSEAMNKDNILKFPTQKNPRDEADAFLRRLETDPNYRPTPEELQAFDANYFGSAGEPMSDEEMSKHLKASEDDNVEVFSDLSYEEMHGPGGFDELFQKLTGINLDKKEDADIPGYGDLEDPYSPYHEPDFVDPDGSRSILKFPGSDPKNIKEGLSRGSLYRKKYFGRY